MTDTHAQVPGSSAPRDESVRRAYRDTARPVLGGVAGGLARHLGLPVIALRLGFLVLSTLSGLGIVLYAGFWIVLPAEPITSEEAPGLESARRSGLRPARRKRRFTDIGMALTFFMLAFGVLMIASSVTGQGIVFWAFALLAGGIALIWRQADEAQLDRWLDASGRMNPLRAVFGNGGWAAYARVLAGLTLMSAAIVVFSLRAGSLSLARETVLATLLGIAGVALVLGPWIYRLTRELTSERAERIRTQERADVAAHLHDSVLQTLALIQRNHTDPAMVAKLARAQERDLRSWLYIGESVDDSTVASALRAVGAEIDDAYTIAVDVVVVGDADMDEALRPIVLATREATTNAAKHSGVQTVSVYAEINRDEIEVFVRDRGVGFDPDVVPADRHGLKDSIYGRMERHGGSVTVHSTPGEGTNVRLRLPREGEGS